MSDAQSRSGTGRKVFVALASAVGGLLFVGVSGVLVVVAGVAVLVALLVYGATTALEDLAELEPAHTTTAAMVVPVGLDAVEGEDRTLSDEDIRVPVRFEFNSYEAIQERGFGQFLRAARTHDGDIVLTGHTDNHGTADQNRVMGLGRSWSVSLLMAAGGIDERRMALKSAGEHQPIASNDSEDGRAANRRVTATFVPKRSLADVLPPPPKRVDSDEDEGVTANW